MSKVQLGFFSFTEITRPDEHRAYNAWHMYDHMPEQYPIDGVAWGQRWVSTPACRAARFAGAGAVEGEGGAGLHGVHYVTCYLMGEPVDRTLREFYDLGRDLRALGRFHEHRRSHLSGPFRLLDTAVAPRALVRAEAVPYRPHTGIFVIVEGFGDDAATQWAHAEHGPALLATPGVVGAWTFASTSRYADHPWTTGNRRITVCWLDADPCTVAAALDPLLRERAERFPVELAGPFETIAPDRWDWFD